MARLMRPLASLLAVATTVATPALLAACLALCMPGMRGHAMAAPAASASTGDRGCPGHEAAAPVTPAAAVTASAFGCCVEGLTSASPSVTVDRADTRRGLDSALAPRVTFASTPRPHATVRATHVGGSPPPPLRRPSVLRI